MFIGRSRGSIWARESITPLCIYNYMLADHQAADPATFNANRYGHSTDPIPTQNWRAAPSPSVPGGFTDQLIARREQDRAHRNGMSDLERANRDLLPMQTARFQRNLLASYAREDPDDVDLTAGIDASMQWQPGYNTVVSGTQPTVPLSSLGDSTYPAELEC